MLPRTYKEYRNSPSIFLWFKGLGMLKYICEKEN